MKLRLKHGRIRHVIVTDARREMSAGVSPDPPLVMKGGCHFGYFSHLSLQQYSERLDLTYSQTRQRKMVLRKCKNHFISQKCFHY